MNPAQKHLLKTWIAAILWLGIIVTESTNLASADNTSRIFYPLLHFGIIPARLADSGKVAFHIGGKNRHADAAETFRHHLQRDRFARAGGASDEAVPIGHAGQQVQRVVPLGDQKRVCHEILRGAGRLGDLLVR